MSHSQHQQSSIVHQRFWRILYIDDQVDEKRSELILESGVSELNPKCLFTIVSNTFAGLERIETTTYDMILIKEYLPEFPFALFEHVIQNIHLHIPIIRIYNRMRYSLPPPQHQSSSSPLFLLYPFTFPELQELIIHCMKAKFGHSFHPLPLTLSPYMGPAAIPIPMAMQSNHHTMMYPTNTTNTTNYTQQSPPTNNNKNAAITTATTTIIPPSSLSSSSSSSSSSANPIVYHDTDHPHPHHLSSIDNDHIDITTDNNNNNNQLLSKSMTNRCEEFSPIPDIDWQSFLANGF
jgi:hypothetical protein